mgnify:CR=1 FL=1
MRLADYIARKLAEAGLYEVFMVTGGAAMHLNDAFGRDKSFRIHHLHHEQSCAMAAEAFGRISRKAAIVNTTAGPGAINAMNGVFGAYVDSIPMIVISGNSKRETLTACNQVPGLRQLGDQEANVVELVKPITKYAKLIIEPQSIGEEIEKCIYLTHEGRPGPCWLDVPIDVQSQNIAVSSLKVFKPNSIENTTAKLQQQLYVLNERLTKSKRPLIFAGSGIRSSKNEESLLRFAEELDVPIVTAWNSNDLIWDDHPLYAGRPGSVGNRAGNFAIQTCDLLIIMGCRLNIRLITYNWKSFADKAWKCQIDVDKAELEKPTVDIDLKINEKLSHFFQVWNEMIKKEILPKDKYYKWHTWLSKCKQTYPVCVPDEILQKQGDYKVDPYFLIDTLTQHLSDNDIVTFGDGTACVSGFQAAKIKKGQRLFHNSGCASMGYGLPAAIGAYFASKRKIFCVTGDGSIMMNIQEFAVISGLSIPITLFILDNQGYHSIRQTQSNYFPDNFVGCGDDSGLYFPDFEEVARGFGLKSLKLSTNNDVYKHMSSIVSMESPVVVVVELDLNREFSPKVSSRKLDNGIMTTTRLEDMSPFLNRNELKETLDEGLSS